MPGVALQQARHRVQQEPQQRAVWFGQVERALQGPAGGARVAERVPGDRLQQERLNQPGRPDYRCGAVQDRRDRGHRRARVVSGKPQHRGSDAHLPVVAVAVAEAGEGLFGALDFAEAHQGVQQQCPCRREEHVRCGQASAQPLGGLEGGQRVGVTAARQLEHSAGTVHPQHCRGLGVRSEDAFGALDPGPCLPRPHLPGQYGSEYHVGEPRSRLARLPRSAACVNDW